MIELFYESEEKSLINYDNLELNCINKCNKSYNVIKYYILYNNINEKVGELLLNFNYGKLNNFKYFYSGNYTIILPEGNIFVSFSDINKKSLDKCFRVKEQHTTELLGIGQNKEFIGKNYRVFLTTLENFKRFIKIIPLASIDN